MADSYTKLFSDIVDSSIWDEDANTCKVWITLLALCNNADGYVRGSSGWLAGKSHVSKEACEAALAKFSSPDPHSRTPDNDGRRIEALEDGWLILNYMTFRDRLSSNPKTIKTRERVRKHRERFNALRNVTSVTQRYPDSVSVSVQCSDKERGVGKTIGEVFDAWNVQKGIPQCLLVSDKRRRSLEIRLSEPFFSKNWRAALDKVARSGFCKGESDRGWKATFDWFITPDAVVKIMEGKYDGNTNSKAGKPNPRNFGIVRGTTDYGTAKPRLQREREEEAARLAGQVAPAPNNPPAAIPSGG